MSAEVGSKQRNYLGSFPSVGPVTYLTDDAAECLRLMDGPVPPIRTWFHGTTENIARLACVRGIVPGCWINSGGECCGVLGYDTLEQFLSKRDYLWIIEILGPALEGDVKAWWVPARYIQGVWHRDTFISREAIAPRACEMPSTPYEGCRCNLNELCARQRVLWQNTWTTA